MLAMLGAWQRSLIFPGHATQGHRDALVRAPEGCELARLRMRGGDHVTALFGRAVGDDGRVCVAASRCPTVLYFYGNGMCLAGSLGEFGWLRGLGANVLIPEYPGYGMSEGRPSEAACYEAADVALDYLLNRPEAGRGRIIAAGWSLGGAVAIDLAARRSEVAGLAGISTFTSIAEVARTHWPFAPVSLFLEHRFESEGKMAGVSCPILLAHGERDSIIPCGMMARLATAARAPARQVVIRGADHNDILISGRSELSGAFRELFARV